MAISGQPESGGVKVILWVTFLYTISITMTSDNPGTIHSGEILRKSQCQSQETQLVKDISACLQQHNYQNIKSVSGTRSCWQRDNQKIVVSLVDDLWDCAVDKSLDTPYLFDGDTMVITDNHLNCPSVYKIYNPPCSFYGIYSYTPENQDWTPDRDYTFAVNRLDFKRMRVLLQLYQNIGFDSGYVSFNCGIGGMHVPHDSIRRQAFVNESVLYSVTDQERNAFLKLANHVPIKNHTLEHDIAYNQSWTNIIVETYSSDNVISVSEKIFRCLVTPVPWIAYSGRYTVAKLRELGFDVLNDVVDHSYDQLLESQLKMPKFADSAKKTIARAKSLPWLQVKARCQMAAGHNQKLLAEFSRTWNENQSAWLQQLGRDIS